MDRAKKIILSWVICVAVACVFLVSGASAQVNIETVPVGNIGNVGEGSGINYGGTGPDHIVGAVNYTYNMGKYEVTAGQYMQFLNAVAKTDNYGLYNTGMDAYSRGCQITRNGESGNYTYDFSGRHTGSASDWSNRPVNFVSWGDAARFSNWLHNGQPTGMQDTSTTEDGAYFLNGATSIDDLQAIDRESDWKWAIPSNDEWYKAAYHKNNGDTNDYFDFPTGSDSLPSNDLIDPDPGNNATYYDWGGDVTIGYPYYRTEVGAHENSASPYSTFDQGGNISEWTESILMESEFGPFRWTRGGAYGSETGYAAFMRAAVVFNVLVTDENETLGFRVTEVPEPATMSLLAFGGLAILRRRRR